MTSSHQSNQAEIGMVGLGVMGRNLLLNMAGHGFSVAGYDQDSEQVAALERETTTHAVRGTTDIKEFIGMLRSPRAVMLLPVPALSASLGYFEAYSSGWLPANLIQAQRDYFGAHTYERIDAKGTFHTQWEETQKLK